MWPYYTRYILMSIFYTPAPPCRLIFADLCEYAFILSLPSPVLLVFMCASMSGTHDFIYIFSWGHLSVLMKALQVQTAGAFHMVTEIAASFIGLLAQVFIFRELLPVSSRIFRVDYIIKIILSNTT